MVYSYNQRLKGKKEAKINVIGYLENVQKLTREISEYREYLGQFKDDCKDYIVTFHPDNKRRLKHSFYIKVEKR